MAVDYGGMVSGESLVYGVPITTWDTWTQQQKDLYLQDYNRTDAQKDYVSEQSLPYHLAYIYTGIIDHYLGTESVETGEWVNEEFLPKVEDALDTGKDYLWTGLILGALYLALKD